MWRMHEVGDQHASVSHLRLINIKGGPSRLLYLGVSFWPTHYSMHHGCKQMKKKEQA